MAQIGPQVVGAVYSGGGTLTNSSSVTVVDGGPTIELELNGVTWDSTGTIYDYGATVLTGGAVWDNSGTVSNRYGVQFGTSAGDSATLINEAGATFVLNAVTGDLSAPNSGTYSIVNAGLLEFTGGGVHYISVPLTNTGVVEANATIVEVQGTGQALGGTFDAVSGGGVLALVGSFAAASGATDTVALTGVNLGWYGDGAAVLSGPGTLASTGTATVTDWGANTQLEVTGGLTWDTSGTVYDYGSTVLAGGAVWDNSGTVYSRYGIQFGANPGDTGTFVNEVGALFDITAGRGNLTAANAGSYNFINKGMLWLNGGGNVYINVGLINTGLVGTSNGLLEVQGVSEALGGTFQATGGGVLALVGSFTAASGATDTVTFTGVNLGWQSDGAAVLSGPGTLASAGTATVTDWGANTQLEVTGGLTWDTSGTVYDYGSTVLAGGSVWDNSGTVYSRYGIQFGTSAGDSATLINEAGATFNLNGGAGDLGAPNSGNYSFLNKGAFLVTAGGDHYVTAPITNTGIIEVDAGDLHLNGGGTSTGQINVGPGAAITFGSDFTASTLNDSGTVLISGGTFTLNGALTEGGPVSVQIGAGATFDASGGSFATAESFNFTGTSGTLELNSAELSTAANATQVTGFNSGDVLKITDAATRATWSDNVLTLFNGDTAIGSVNLVGDYANANFLVTSTGSGNSQITLSGLAVDGYIAGATVFADAQGTGVYAAGDASSTTNALGQFSLPGGSGPLILTGGVDEGTNLKFTGVLSAPSGSSVITPLTTLVTVMAGANPSAGALAAAEAAVQQAFGLTLPPGSSLTDFDPEAGTAVETPGAILVFAAGAQVQDTLALLAAGLIQAGASAASANAAALHALANAISGAPSSLDLSDPATVKALVTAATSALTGLNPFSTTDLATLISASNATIVSDTTAFSGSEAIREISAGERVAQGDTASAVTTSGASQTVLDAYTGANLDSAVNAALADVICFMPGTRIRTPDGDREVESLQIGDLVTSSDGLDLPVRWIGRQTVRPASPTPCAFFRSASAKAPLASISPSATSSSRRITPSS